LPLLPVSDSIYLLKNCVPKNILFLHLIVVVRLLVDVNQLQLLYFKSMYLSTWLN